MNRRKPRVAAWQGSFCLLALTFFVGCTTSAPAPKLVSGPVAKTSAKTSAPVPVSVAPKPAQKPLSADAQDVLATLDSLEHAIESKDLNRVLQQISVYYSDERDNSYPTLKQFFQTMFEQYATIDVSRSNPVVTVNGPSAEVRETFRTKATPRPGTTAAPIDVEGDVVIHLRRVAGEWLVAQWAGTENQH